MANAALPFIVTLNLFQGPLGRFPRSGRVSTHLAVGLRSELTASGSAEEWALKQVQGDGLEGGLV